MKGYNSFRQHRRRPVIQTTFSLSLLALAMNSAFAADPADAHSAGNAPADKTVPRPEDSKGKGPTSTNSGSSVATLGKVTVKSAHRPNQAVVSRARQEVAPNIISTTSQEEARKLPDINAGEAAARLPGVSLETDTGQGRYVNIRGLDSDLTSTTYAGIHLPPTNPVTPQGGGRAFAFDTFPTGMIGTLTVTKTNKPEQDAEALGGTLEISPKEIPAGKDHFVDFRLGTGRRDARGTGVADLSITAGTRFGFHNSSSDDKSGVSSYSDKPFSFVGSLTYFQDASGTDHRDASFYDKSGYPGMSVSQMKQAYYRFHRVTTGFGGELAYQPSADDRYYLRYLHSGYTENVNRQQQIFKMSGTPSQNADGSFTSGVSFQKAARFMEEQVSLDVFQLGGQNALGGGAKIDYNVAYAQGKDYRPYDTLATYSAKTPGATITYNNQSNIAYPSYTIAGANQLDPSLYNLSALTNNSQTYLTREWSGGTNVTVPTHLTSASDEELKFGVYARFRTTTHTIDPYNSQSVPASNMSQAIVGDPIRFYNNQYLNGYNISQSYIQNLFANGSGAGFSQKSTDAIAALASQTRNTENVFAGYAQEQMTFGRLTLLGGLRVEATRATYGGYATDANLTHATPVSVSNNYVNFFPSLQARYEFTPSLIGRASYSSTIARPGFTQANPSATVDTSTYSVTQGNPSLKPTVSQNFDVSIEQYLNHGGIVSVGVFDKELSNYIVGNTRTTVFSANDPLFGSIAGAPAQVVSYTNIAKARALGLEFNYDQHYTMLPGVLSGLGSSFNWTYVSSSGQIRPGQTSALPSTSRNTYNAQVYWENNRFSVRVAGYYVGRSLLLVGSSAATDEYTEGHFNLDVGASYAINKDLSIYFAARNLLDTPLTFTEGTSNRVITRELYGKTFLIGLTGHFN